MTLAALAQKTLGGIFWMLLKLLDIGTNVLFNGRVETISSRAGRARASGLRWGCVLCRLLDAIQANHCADAMKDPLSGLEK